MFGLEDQKNKKKPAEFVFDLEKQLKEAKVNKEITEKVLERIQTIKRLLQEGIEKEDFDTIGKILYGYSSLLKVIGRVPIKK